MTPVAAPENCDATGHAPPMICTRPPAESPRLDMTALLIKLTRAAAYLRSVSTPAEVRLNAVNNLDKEDVQRSRALLVVCARLKTAAVVGCLSAPGQW